MFKNISLGTYYPGNSLLHRLQARTKLLLLVWISIFLVIANNRFWHFTPFIVLVSLAFASVAAAGVTPRQIWRRIWWLVLLALLGAVPTLFTTDSDTVKALYAIGPFVITDLGAWLLVSFSTVFVILYTFSLLLTMTTTPIALIEGMTILLNPLRWLRLPVDDFALMTLIALRFIPTLIEEVEQLLKAQISRGADYAHGSIRERVQSFIALFVPLLQAVLRRAADLATALEARGYQGDGHKTLLHEKSFGVIDYGVLVGVAVVTIGALIL